MYRVTRRRHLRSFSSSATTDWNCFCQNSCCAMAAVALICAASAAILLRCSSVRVMSPSSFLTERTRSRTLLTNAYTPLSPPPTPSTRLTISVAFIRQLRNLALGEALLRTVDAPRLQPVHEPVEADADAQGG